MIKPSHQQWRRYKLWLDNDCNVKATAKSDGSQPEIIRRAIAACHRQIEKSKP